MLHILTAWLSTSAMALCDKGLCQQGLDGERVQYIPFDFHFHSKQRGAQVLAQIAPTVQAVLAQTGIFACPPALPSPDAHRLAAATWVGLNMCACQTCHLLVSAPLRLPYPEL